MGVAEGKPTPIRAIAKNDTVSHLLLPAEASLDELKQWIGAPEFIPTPGHWMQAQMDDESVFFVIESKEHPSYFHISKLYLPLGFDVETLPDGAARLIQTPYVGPEDGWIDGTKKPVLAAAVESFLQHMGMEQPAKVAWSRYPHPGVSESFGMPGSNLGAMWTAIEALTADWASPTRKPTT